MQSDPQALLTRVLAELDVDAPYYGARSFADGRVEVYLYGGRKLTWPDDAQSHRPSGEALTPLEPAILQRPSAQEAPFIPLPERYPQAEILAALGSGPLHKLSVWNLRKLAHMAGLHPSAQLKSIPKAQLVRELTVYRATHRIP